MVEWIRPHLKNTGAAPKRDAKTPPPPPKAEQPRTAPPPAAPKRKTSGIFSDILYEFFGKTKGGGPVKIKIGEAGKAINDARALAASGSATRPSRRSVH